jgi:hypothetical protein
MARRLDSFPSATPPRYPWGEWLNGEVWELRQGEDFRAKASTLRANAQLQAKKRGGRVHTRYFQVEGSIPERVILQFEPGA